MIPSSSWLSDLRRYVLRYLAVGVAIVPWAIGYALVSIYVWDHWLVVAGAVVGSIATGQAVWDRIEWAQKFSEAVEIPGFGAGRARVKIYAFYGGEVVPVQELEAHEYSAEDEALIVEVKLARVHRGRATAGTLEEMETHSQENAESSGSGSWTRPETGSPAGAVA